MKRIPLSLSVLGAIVIFMGSCKDTSPEDLQYASQGFIKGTITGSTQSNTILNDAFNYSQFEKWTQASFYSLDGGEYAFNFSRSDFSTGGGASLDFYLSSATDTSPDVPVMAFDYYKPGSDKFVHFYMESESGANTISITEFSFNSTTGQVKGKYSVTGTENTTGKSATVAGEFDLIAKRIDE